MPITNFIGARIFDGQKLRSGYSLSVANGRVVSLAPESTNCPGRQIKLNGGIIAPGFVELQSNGGGGMMLQQAQSVADIAHICAAHSQLGVTAILPTLMSSELTVLKRVIELGIAAARANIDGFVGLHLEGPHLAKGYKGAHNASHLRPMGKADLELLLQAGRQLPCLLVTLAPECCQPEQIARLVDAGVIVSLGHSGCSHAQAMAAVNAGARCVTHLFNAMRPLHHREPGLIGATLNISRLYAGLIADGLHVNPEVMSMALAAKQGGRRIFLVSDSMAVAGSDIQEFYLDGRLVKRTDGKLCLADGTLAGADCSLAQAVRFMVQKLGLEIDHALAMATSVPAAVIKRSNALGHLLPNYPANLIYLSDSLELKRLQW